MKLTKKYLNSIHIFNSHDIARIAGNKLFISYSPEETGRAYQSASWQVIGLKFQTDPHAHWADYGNKTFSVYRRDEKLARLQEAIEWTKEHYQITEWERDVFGDYQIKGTLGKIMRLTLNPS